MKNVNVKDLKELLDNNSDIQVLDVRSKDEWDMGHINNDKVVNLDINELLFNSNSINPNKPTYVICASGGRSSVAQVLLKTKGIDATNVVGGMNEWISKGYHTTS